MLTVMALMLTVPWITMLVEDRRQSVSVVPQEPSRMGAAAFESARNQTASPVAAAFVSLVIAFAVATPALALANAGFAKVQVASNVCVVSAVSAVAGCGAL